MEKETQKEDILDSIKKVEKVVKVQLLMKSLEELKKKAKKVLELKQESTWLLEEVGVDTKDIKRVIDFINESVKLTEEDIKDIQRNVKSFLRDKKEYVQRDMDKTPYWGGTITGTGGNQSYYTSALNTNAVNCSSLGVTSATSGQTLNINI